MVNQVNVPLRFFVSTLLSLLVSSRAYQKKNLTRSGAVFAFFLGLLVTYASTAFCAALLMFFYVSAFASKIRKRQKERLDPDFSELGRNWVQVVCNGSVAAAFAFLYIFDCGPGERYIDFDTGRTYWCSYYSVSVLYAICGCAGDTLASEIGSVFAKSQPRLATQLWRSVPAGTHGGMTIVGTLASILGGVLVGMAFITANYLCIKGGEGEMQIGLLYSCGVSGVLGSLIDSMLGATLQYTGYDSRNATILHSPGEVKRLQQTVEGDNKEEVVYHVSGLSVLSNDGVNIVSSILLTAIMPRVH